MDIIFRIMLLITAVVMALISGLFYSYSCSVNLGLGRLSDSEYLRAMQEINRAILNPWFFASFMGTLIAMPVSTWLSYKYGSTVAFYLLLSATLIYTVGVFGVTIFGNVPLNEALDKFDIGTATSQQLKVQRTEFEIPWNRLNFIRTVANFVSLVLLMLALVFPDPKS